jgi:hypothetical protein
VSISAPEGVIKGSCADVSFLADVDTDLGCAVRLDTSEASQVHG